MRNKRTLFFLVLMIAVAIAGLRSDPRPVDEVDRAEDSDDTLSVLGNLKPEVEEKRSVPENAIQFVDDKIGVATRVSVGSAGIYPPREVESDAAGYLDRNVFESESGEVVEVYARGKTGPVALWREWERAPEASSRIALIPAHAVDVEVMRADEPVPDAKVRIGKAAVSLIWVKSTTDEGGVATFDAIPAGKYVVQASANGQHGFAEIEVGVDDAAHTIELQGAPEAIRGVVKNEEGDGVPNAMVVLLGQDDEPLDVVTTNMFGQYEASPPRQPTRVVARHPMYSTQQNTLVGAIPSYDLTMKRGAKSTIRVVDSGGAPFPQALVQWRVRDDVGEQQLSNDEGIVRFDNVPPDAVLVAISGESRSAKVKFAEEIELKIESGGASVRPFRFRLIPAPGVAIDDVEIESGDRVCTVDALSENDYQISGCQEGKASLSVHTTHGYVSRDVDVVDGFEVRLPVPASYNVQFVGKDIRWSRVTIKMFDGAARTVANLDLVDAERAEWKTTAYAGTYQFEIHSIQFGETSVRATLGDDPNPVVELFVPEQVEFWVVDAQSAPVTNAHISIWHDDRLQDVKLSGGQLPTELAIGDRATLLVVDPRRGEAVSPIPGDGRFVLTGDVGGNKVPSDRLSAQEVAKRIKTEVVRRDAGYMFDAKPGSHAHNVGLRPGDLYVTAFPVRDGDPTAGATRLVVFRNGYLEVVF